MRGWSPPTHAQPASSLDLSTPGDCLDEKLAEEEPERRIWRVADLVSEVRQHIERGYPDLWVRGEISNLRSAPSGHLYFTLKDGDAQLPAVLFRRQAQFLRFRPEDGLEVLLRGRVSVYEQRGQMQLIAEALEPVGAGSLQLAFEQLKKKLEAEGLFAMDRKRQLPLYPHCVGIVTSPTGAVIRDFVNVANRRHAALDVLLYPATVQGTSAAVEIAAGIGWFNQMRNVDVIVIARGGGSLEDLAPFNSEMVARAIAASLLPVVSAVGHETDFTIADFVADLRAPTPSSAAELITAAQHRVEEEIAALHERMQRAVRYAVAMAQRRLAALQVAAGLTRVSAGVGRREQRLDELRFRMDGAQKALIYAAAERLHTLHAALLRQDATQQLATMRERLNSLHRRLERTMLRQLEPRQQQNASLTMRLAHNPLTVRIANLRQQQKGLAEGLGRAMQVRQQGAVQALEGATRTLVSLSPLAVLGRGYALVFEEAGTLLRKAASAQPGESVRIRLADGELAASVTGKPKP